MAKAGIVQSVKTADCSLGDSFSLGRKRNYCEANQRTFDQRLWGCLPRFMYASIQLGEQTLSCKVARQAEWHSTIYSFPRVTDSAPNKLTLVPPDNISLWMSEWMNEWVHTMSAGPWAAQRTFLCHVVEWRSLSPILSRREVVRHTLIDTGPRLEYPVITRHFHYKLGS